MESSYVEIPIDQLPNEVLWNVVEDYVLREGTDYGHQDFTREEKVTQVLKSLKSGRAKLVFDSTLETHTIVTPQEFRRLIEKTNEQNT